MAALGTRRSVYLPDVIFEHTNAIEHPTAGRIYTSDPVILAQDALMFDALFPSRKERTLWLLGQITGDCNPTESEARRAMLESITDPFALRTPGRQHVVRLPWWRRSPAIGKKMGKLAWRVRDCIRQKGFRGLALALGRRVMGKKPRQNSTATQLSEDLCGGIAPAA